MRPSGSYVCVGGKGSIIDLDYVRWPVHEEAKASSHAWSAPTVKNVCGEMMRVEVSRKLPRRS